MVSDVTQCQTRPSIRHVVGIVAGKGGVGKSTLTAQLAYFLQEKGFKVGLLDADIYGPSLRQMAPEGALPQQHPDYPDRVLPAVVSHPGGSPIKLMSMAYFIKEGDSASVRAPIANGMIKQFIHGVDWGELDYLLIDFPPGTGDIQLTLLQEATLSGAVVITTPQEVALADVRKAISMLEQMRIPVFGVVENMSYFLDPASERRFFPFGEGGGRALAADKGLFFLGEIPLDPLISSCCDRGLFLKEGGSTLPVIDCFEKISSALVEQVEAFAELERYYTQTTSKIGWV